MNVAPWNGMYTGLRWYWMVLNGIEWYWTVLNSIWWYWMGSSQISKEILCMKFKWLQVGQHQTPQYRLSWRKVRKRNMLQPHKIGQPWDAHQVTGLTWKGEEGTQGKNMGCCGKFREAENGCTTCTRLYLAVPGCTWLYLAVPGCTWLYLAVPGSTWLYLALPGCTRL